LMPFAAILARRGASDRYRIGALRNRIVLLHLEIKRGALYEFPENNI
jgi:hypothetical protein